ncbi:MAG: polysaccharide export protein [Azovibrio sp.]|nr:polysaccharide export protein [Azovibrio sp.]
MTKLARLLSFILAFAIAQGAGLAQAQIIPGIFGAQTAQPATEAAQPATAATPLVPSVSASPTPGISLPFVNPAAPRDQIVVVQPAPRGSMFGSQLFGGTFRGTLNHGFNPDYVLAIGDRIILRMWGGFTFEGALTVDQQGNIFIPNVGPVRVAGVKSGELNAVVERAVRRVYKANVWAYAALDASQPVKVYVTGFVRQPGLYGGLASDSPITYLDKAGGVDPDRGSYLDIVIKRGDRVRKRVDLYQFLIDGRLDIVQMQDGDVIVVGPRQHTFRVEGEVFNAYDFEFAEPEIPLERALAMAKPKPGATHVSIVRRQGTERRSEYYPLAEAAKVTLQDGDQVFVTADRYQGTIQIRVEGAHSGEHAVVLPYGSRLKDVLDQLKTNTMSDLDGIQLYRKSVKARQKEMLDLALRKIEEAALSARSKTSEEASLRSREADLILKFVERARTIEPKGQVVLDAQARSETLLEDGDVIVIPEKTSLVMVHGEVLFPNAVSWREGKSLRDYIQSAGGYTQSADTSKVVVISRNGAARRVESGFWGSSDIDIQSGDEIIVLPKIGTKNVEVTRALTQILYQIAFTAKVAFGF